MLEITHVLTLSRWDPHGFMTEHYIDGDVVNKETSVSFHPASSARDAAWGPDVPQEFLE